MMEALLSDAHEVMENNAIRQSIAGPWAVIRRVCRLLPGVAG